MSHHILADSYISYFNEAVEKYKSDRIEALLDEINLATETADTDTTNNVSKKIFDWNGLVARVQDVRNFLLSYDETLILPSLNKYLILFDNITNRWKLSSEAE